MKYADVTERLAHLGGAKWEVHALARQLKAEGRDVIELTIGEPDAPPPETLLATAAAAMRAGRIGYSDGRGEERLREALARRYTERRGREITPDQVLCFPGTQTTLYAVMRGLAQEGCEVIVGDPMYATYEGVIAASGATAVRVALKPENRFHIKAQDIAAAITPRTRLLLLNTPHNPTGAVLSLDELREIGALCIKHDLWLLCDEVYEELVFPGTDFASPLSLPELAERTIVAASISKSHAAPGFRSGWAIGPADWAARLLPLSEVMLFGNQPFIADMTAEAVASASPIAAGMVERFSRRAGIVRQALHGIEGLRVHSPEGGMFALVDVGVTGLGSRDFALSLLREKGVAVMPGASFGESLSGWLRLSLTQPDELVAEACGRIAEHARGRA